MEAQPFTFVNTPQPDEYDLPAPFPREFSLSAPPQTDIYATAHPAPVHIFSGPIAYRQIEKQKFTKAAVTVSLNLALPYDQGGLIFILPTRENPHPNAANAAAQDKHPEWVKCGIELNDGIPNVSVVSKSRENWADWSLWPLLPTESTGEATIAVTVEMVRWKTALKIQRVMEDGRRLLVRKVPWVFQGDDGSAGEIAHVGVYGCRPDPEERAGDMNRDKDLKISFQNFSLDAEP